MLSKISKIINTGQTYNQLTRQNIDIFQFDKDTLDQYQQCSERLKGLEGVVDCRLKPPSMDLLFKHLCGE
ncbi:ABC transporter family protein [Spironucleus salmonicida]|uniref:ABC transporter family protein n=1 Tax=Spironucleus salmonicida TaxID=348837 RepID=A0A9P8LP26_9EUKA|nr:ABC transporter family protein [Spironucleus salmonicida]